MRRTRIAALAAVGFCIGAVPASAPASRAIETSTNWTGYVVTGKRFVEVNGRSVQPAANCLVRATRTEASFWVALGGYTEESKKIEQVGTTSECTENGREYRFVAETTASHVVPTALSRDGRSFSARWVRGRPPAKPTARAVSPRRSF